MPSTRPHAPPLPPTRHHEILISGGVSEGATFFSAVCTHGDLSTNVSDTSEKAQKIGLGHLSAMELAGERTAPLRLS